MFLRLQKHSSYPLKHHLLAYKSIAFVTQNLCFWKMKTIF
ncbi:hypothetical protein HMPREF9151_02120 [Hoylesella saccharolytica F0055]|uniref:Uncharacterized protein n=1 Tax=Hoylesella saccharolytica F0055 TaxID=1127699 RepID=L1N2F6_9BACT|nr:hypothetical protein HMPREF9151_02120 [Hoylesella saccharolytica F0055]